jgi:glutamate/tyrosine decarboxylase-like PLP-dependent enzyme
MTDAGAPAADDLADDPLARAAELGRAYLAGVADRPVGQPVAPDALREALGGPLPESGEDPVAVIEALARNVDPGLVATAGPRYFGFVTGGSLPAAAAAEWLATAWDQNGFGYVASPAASVVEEVAGGWLLDLFGLPANAGVGFVTGATMANFTALAAARHGVLRAVGWDVEADGLIGAPPIHVLIGEEAHATIPVALRYVGLGAGRAIRVAADDQGRMRPDALQAALAGLEGPTIVCARPAM